MKILFIVLGLSLSLVSTAEAKFSFDPDCENYCSFLDKPNNCQGVRFLQTKRNGKTQYFYTYWRPLVNRCVDTWGNSASRDQIQAKCSCEGAVKYDADLSVSMDAPMTEKTKSDLVQIRAKVQDWAMCGPDPMTVNPADPLRPYQGSDLKSCKQMKADGKPGYIVLPDCIGFEDGRCIYYGNTNNIAAPYCYLGDEDRCNDVKLGQDPVTGAWFRNAYQRRFPLAERGQPLFSRDEVLGIFIYIAAKKDKAAALKWLNFVAHNPKKKSSILGKMAKVYNICQNHVPNRPADIDPKTWEEMQPDDRCEMRPDGWGQFYLLLKYVGATDAEIKAISPKLFVKMKFNSAFVGSTNMISALTVPAKGSGSYQLGLQATTTLLLSIIGYADKHPIVQKTAQAIDKRFEHASPYFRYLALGRHSSEYGAQLIKRMCETSRPFYGPTPKGWVTSGASYFDIATQYFGGRNAYNTYEKGIGHDCIAWINFYLSDQK